MDSAQTSRSSQLHLPQKNLTGDADASVMNQRICEVYRDFSENRGNTPKWMVKIMENPIKMDDFGGTTIFGNTHRHSVLLPFAPNFSPYKFN